MNCVFSDGTDTCCRCGVQSPWPSVPRNCRPGLGDRVHAGLAAVGITPERVAATLGVDDCGCEGRRQLLNEAGYAIGIGSPPTGPQG
jgi:hypothetical protein